MKKDVRTISLIISTVCILLINLANLLEYLDTGYIGSTLSNICFITGDICIIIAWAAYFIDKKKQQ